MSEFVTKDSGERRDFGTGSVRDVREGKGRFDLLPYHGIKRLANLYERGAVKYGDDNWTLGQNLRSYCDSMIRHAMQAKAGYTDEDHFAAVAWNALAVIDHQERIRRGELPAELDDLPRPRFASADQIEEPEKVPTSTEFFADLCTQSPGTFGDLESWRIHSTRPLRARPEDEPVAATPNVRDILAHADQVETVTEPPKRLTHYSPRETGPGFLGPDY